MKVKHFEGGNNPETKSVKVKDTYLVTINPNDGIVLVSE